jgi:hypothetical protein
VAQDYSSEQSVDIETIKTKVQNGKFVISTHADQEAADENIDIAEIRDALLSGELLEQYPDTGRGESCLILGFANDKPIHIVCGWHRDSVVIITVYIPKPPKFDDPRTRRRLL